nr:MAG TPA: hypothetical protein [Bacteriophage sp.]
MADVLLNFKYGTQAGYDGLESYDDGTLYFTTDTLALYKGSKLYNGGVKSVAALPETPALGVLYILTTTWTGQIWTGSAWKVITKPFIETIDGAKASHASVPTEKAVVDYVTNAIANVTGGKGIFVTDIAYSTTNNAIKVSKGEGVSTEIKIDGMVHNATYDSSKRKVSLPVVNGTTVEFTIPEDKDLVVKAGKYEAAAEEIWLSIDPTGAYTNASNVIKIPVADLIDEIVAGNTSTITMTYDKDTNTISGAVKISATEGNALSAKEDGLMVDVSDKLNKGAWTDDNKIIVSKQDGTIVAATYTIGGTTFDGTSTTTVALESAVANYVNTKINETYTNATNYTNSTNTAMKTYVDGKFTDATNAVNAANTAMKTYVDEQDTATLGSAKDYTNTTNTAMKTYVDGAIKTAMTWKTF